MKEKVIFLADMQSFYASVEKAERPELKDQPVVVSGDPQRRSGIILAACPIAKAYGVKTAEALWQAQQKCPHITVIRPRMQKYIDVSVQITRIFEQYTDLVEPYSIDEQFLDVTGSQRLFGSPEEIACKVQQQIWKETGVWARIGIGPNKVLAKICCDNMAKKSASGIHRWTEETFRDEMWPLPVEALFGIGSRMKRHLNNMGIRTIGHLAEFPLEKLKQRWGINGHVLWLTANGKDLSDVSVHTYERQKAIGHHMTLPRDYRKAEEIRVVVLELSEEVCFRARNQRVMGATVSVGCRGTNFDVPTGFHRQMTLAQPTNATMEVFRAAWKLFMQHWDRAPVRSLGIALSNLQPDLHLQLDLFEDREKKRRLGYVMDSIKKRYGSDAIVRAVSKTEAGQAFERSAKIGGHYK